MSEKHSRSAMHYALTLLSRKDYPASILSQKLLSKGYSADDIEKVCHQLIQWKYLDDARYAHRFIATYSKKYGNAYLAQKLTALGISSQIIDTALQSNTPELQRSSAFELAYRKLSRQYARETAETAEIAETDSITGIDGMDQQYLQIYRMLMRRGYAISDVRYAVERAYEQLSASAAEPYIH